MTTIFSESLQARMFPQGVQVLSRRRPRPQYIRGVIDGLLLGLTMAGLGFFLGTVLG